MASEQDKMRKFLSDLTNYGTEFTAEPDNFDAQLFAKCIASDAELTSVDLSYPFCELEEEDIKIICDGLSNNTALKGLIIIGAEFTPELFSYLTTSLAHTAIEKFTIGSCDVPDCDFSNLQIQQLSCTNMVLAAEQIRDIVSNPHLTNLKITAINLGEDGSKLIAGILNKLTKLDLTNTHFTDVIYDYLKDNTSLISLVLNSSTNTDKLLVALKGNTSLKSLRLGSNVNNGNFADLMQLSLEKIRLTDTRVTDILPLKDNMTIKEVIYFPHQIYPDMFKRIGEVLSENNTLQSLRVAYLDYITADDVKPVIKSLRTNNTLETLHFSGVHSTNTDDVIKWLGNNYSLKKITGLSGNIASFKDFLSEEQRMDRLQKMRRLLCTKRS